MPFAGHRLQELREAQGRSRERLAGDIGRSYPAVVAYESGRVTPPLPVAEAIAQALGVPLADLLDEGDQ